MPPQQLIEYIRQETARGVPQEAIKNALLAAGWQAEIVEQAFAFLAAPPTQSSPEADHSSTPPSEEQSPQFAGESSDAHQAGSVALPGVGALLREAFAHYKARFLSLIGILLLGGILMAAIFILGAVVYLPLIRGAGGIAEAAFLLFGVSLGAAVLSLLAQGWVGAAFLYALVEPITALGAFRRGWSKTFSFLWLSLLIWAIVLAGLVLFIVPGVLFVVWFSMAPFLLITQGDRGTYALIKSREYVRGYGTAVFWRIAVIAVISVLLGSLVGTAAAISKMVGPPLLGRLSVWIVIVYNLLWIPFVFCYWHAVYRHLRAIKGDITPPAARRQRIAFLSLATLGALILPLLLAVSVIMDLREANKRAQTAQVHSEVVEREAQNEAQNIIEPPNAVSDRRRAAVAFLQTNLEFFHDSHGRYPATLEEVFSALGYERPPENLWRYQYRALEGGQDYELCAELEPGEGIECFSRERPINLSDFPQS